MVFLLVLFALAPVFGQDADSNRLRALLKTVPLLPVERIDLKLKPPLMLDGISAVTTDKRGNIFVIHRPANGDPIVVLDSQGNFTQSNNQITSAQSVFTLDTSLNLQAIYKGQTLSSSFVDTGSNAFFFPDSTIPLCAGNSIAPDFFCPTSIQNLSATIQDPNGTGVTKVANFSVDNAVTLFSSNGSDAVYGTLGGTDPVGSFDFGLPFFYGKNVYSAIQGQALPSSLPMAPWVAF